MARNGYVVTPRDGEPIRDDTREDLERAHTKNFLDALTEGVRPNAPLEAGLSASVPVLLAVKSYWKQSAQTTLEETD